MVSVTALWLPILVSSVLVFFASNLIWMVLQLHKNDWKQLPDEEALRKALNSQDLPPAEYSFPYSQGPEDWKSEAWQAKFKEGPVGFLTLMPKGEMSMGKNMAFWFVYVVIIEVFVAYLTGIARPAGAEAIEVFQVAGAVGILGFAGACAPEAIWMGRQWANVFKNILDGLIYGLISAATFAWLWPAGL